MEEKCEHFMRLYINQLINTDDWKNMLSAELQDRIKEGMIQFLSSVFLECKFSGFTSLV